MTKLFCDDCYKYIDYRDIVWSVVEGQARAIQRCKECFRRCKEGKQKE